MTTILDSPDSTSCSCPDYGASRRGVLKGLGVGAAASVIAATTSEGIFRQVAFADTPAAAADTNVLIVLSLRGGADGLSMVVPHGDPAYYAARPRIGVPRSELLASDGFFGLHPSFAPLMPMWRSGKMAAIHAVGSPTPNRSHFAALEEIEDADPGSSARVGWLNRFVGLNPNETATDAIQVGSSMIRTSMYGPAPVLGIQRAATVTLPGSLAGQSSDRKRAALERLYRDDQSPIGSAGRSALDAVQKFAPLTRSAAARNTAYPSTALGDAMADTARLIKSGMGVKVVTLDFGSWDMHVGLGTLSYGLMKPMISEMATAIAALFDDLGAMADKTTLVTLSEFGRRVGENDNQGLDHGFGNAMLVMGSGVRGGQFYSTWPGLDSSGDLVNGDLAVTRDYRSVLTEILRSRTSASIPQVFPGFNSERPLGFMS